MGGINDYIALYHLMEHVKSRGYKVAIYSGHPHMQPGIMDLADYYKVGPYMPEYGSLNSKTTNQRFWKKENNCQWTDITYRFQEERV